MSLYVGYGTRYRHVMYSQVFLIYGFDFRYCFLYISTFGNIVSNIIIIVIVKIIVRYIPITYRYILDMRYKSSGTYIGFRQVIGPGFLRNYLIEYRPSSTSLVGYYDFDTFTCTCYGYIYMLQRLVQYNFIIIYTK